MVERSPDPAAPRLLISNPDPGAAQLVSNALEALGLDSALVSSAEAARSVAGAASALVVTDAEAFLRALNERLARGPADDAGGTLGELQEQAHFLDRAALILAAAQPPNEQVAIVFVHQVLPELATERAREVAHETARRLRSCVRERDAVGLSARAGPAPSLARLSTSDYLVLVPSLPRTHAAFQVAQRLHDRLREPFETSAGAVDVGCTLGIALYPHDATDAPALLARARAAQEGLAGEGQSGVRFHTPAMNAAALQRSTVERALRTALERNEVSVHYQPKVRIATGAIVGAEALVRWRHPELGVVSPGLFVPIAEETGLIHAVGEFVLETACRQNRAWQDAGLPPIRVAVNLSTVQLREERLLAAARRVLAETGLAPQWLELELTESMLLHDADAALRRLHQLDELGVRLSIDDFGTGYSSLAYLKRFPVDTLKIDQAFVRDLTTDPYDAAITTSIILMGKSLKLEVVAEGVETRGQLALLGMLECDEAQGYLLSRPLPPEEFGKLLEHGLDPALFRA